jgi:DNA-binding IclR family transcriptional regulator
VINSVIKAIDILKVFSTSEPRLSLTEISERLEMPKGTTHNLLKTLLSRGFVEKTEEGRYALGTEIIALTQAVRINVELRDRAAPLLRKLADECRESVYLTMRDGDYALYIYAVESPHRLLARTAVGDRVALHCTSVGKAILSTLSQEEIDEIVDRIGLPRFTAATITDLEALHRDLVAIRGRGYAIDRGEHEQNLYCIGAPIYDQRGQTIGACSVSSADPQTLDSRLSALSARVRHVAQEISRRMGYIPASLSAVVEEPSIAFPSHISSND